MTRIVTTVRTVYTFDELSETAKETAREEWSRFVWEDGSAQESMSAIFEDYMAGRGWGDAELRTYSLYSQGGHPTFTGTLPTFEHGGRTWILTVTTRHSGGGSEHMVCDVEPADGTDSDTYYGTPGWDAFLTATETASDAAREMVQDMSSDLLSMFHVEDDYLSSEETVRETAEANGYEYDEDGHLV